MAAADRSKRTPSRRQNLSSSEGISDPIRGRGGITNMTKQRHSGDYAVGYGKPPAHGKIRPGEKRNPSGRPRRPRAPDDIVRRFLSEKVPILICGKRRHITRHEANIRNLYQLGMKGNVRAGLALHQLGAELGLFLAPAKVEKIIIELVESDGNGGMKVKKLRSREPSS